MGNLRQSFRPVVKLAVGIGILKFVGENAADGIGVAHFERLGPGLLDLDEGIAVLGLMGWAVGANIKFKSGGRGRPPHTGSVANKTRSTSRLSRLFPLDE